MSRTSPSTASPPSPGGPGPTRRTGRDLGAAALILLALIWGYNWVVMKIGLGYAQPFTFAALRTFLGALSLFLPWMIGLLVWHADWSLAARMAVIVVLALGWSAMSFPRR